MGYDSFLSLKCNFPLVIHASYIAITIRFLEILTAGESEQVLFTSKYVPIIHSDVERGSKIQPIKFPGDL